MDRKLFWDSDAPVYKDIKGITSTPDAGKTDIFIPL
jgi:hypothetical protein